MRLCWRDIRPSFLKYNPRTTAIPKIIPVVLICTAGIISTSRMHLYLALLLHRDYFRRSDASLSCSFAPQGLFPPAGCISILLFCSTGIISAGRIHPCLPLLSHRDYFRRSDSSPACSFVPQGLFPPVGCIPAFLFCPTGITSTGRMHLYLPLLLHRDYFHQPDASLSCSFVPQGLFCPGWMHLYLDLLFHRDYFHRSNASPACSFAPQGLLPPVGCISILLFCSTGIISTAQMHLYLAFLFHRDYFAPARCIPAFLFCPTGIICPGQMHLYLALLLHRDYFRRPDSSLSRSFAPQGLFPPAKCISILLF